MSILTTGFQRMPSQQAILPYILTKAEMNVDFTLLHKV